MVQHNSSVTRCIREPSPAASSCFLTSNPKFSNQDCHRRPRRTVASIRPIAFRMNPSDLPPAAFRQVIRELVSATGIAEAWKLRGTSHAFSHAIREVILSGYRVETFQNNGCHRILENTIVDYIVYRLREPLDCDQDLFRQIKEVVFILETQSTFDARKKPWVFATICKNYVHYHKPRRVMGLIWPKKLKWPYRSLPPTLNQIKRQKKQWISFYGTIDKVAAAMLANQVDLLRYWVRSSDFNEDFPLGTPIKLALALGQVEMIVLILNHLDTRPQFRLLAVTKHRLVDYAIRCGGILGLRLVLVFCARHYPAPTPEVLVDWRETAVLTALELDRDPRPFLALLKDDTDND